MGLPPVPVTRKHLHRLAQDGAINAKIIKTENETCRSSENVVEASGLESLGLVPWWPGQPQEESRWIADPVSSDEIS
jgi:hypothetical protein